MNAYFTLTKPGHLNCHIFDCHLFVRQGSLLTLLFTRTKMIPDFRPHRSWGWLLL